MSMRILLLTAAEFLAPFKGCF